MDHADPGRAAWAAYLTGDDRLVLRLLEDVGYTPILAILDSCYRDGRSTLAASIISQEMITLSEWLLSIVASELINLVPIALPGTNQSDRSKVLWVILQKPETIGRVSILEMVLAAGPVSVNKDLIDIDKRQYLATLALYGYVNDRENTLLAHCSWILLRRSERWSSLGPNLVRHLHTTNQIIRCGLAQALPTNMVAYLRVAL